MKRGLKSCAAIEICTDVGNLLNRPLPFNRLQRNLGFPISAVLPPCSLHSASSRRQRFYTLHTCPNFGEHFTWHLSSPDAVGKPPQIALLAPETEELVERRLEHKTAAG